VASEDEKMNAPIDMLTPREREVFDLVMLAWTNENVSKELGVSVKTIETHRARINKKLNVKSPAELVIFAVREGLLTRGMLK
jgi:two-component system response regulator NreC